MYLLILCDRGVLGVAFSPDGAYAYVSDTGVIKGFSGNFYTEPATM